MSAKEDLERLLAGALKKAREEMSVKGHFYPFALSLSSDEPKLWALDKAVARQHSSGSVAEWLRLKLKDEAEAGKIFACALCGDAQVKDKNGEMVDSIVIELHHRERAPLVAFLSYQAEATSFGELGFGKSLVSIFPEPEIIPETETVKALDPEIEDRQVLSMMTDEGFDLEKSLYVVNYIYFQRDSQMTGAGSVLERAGFEVEEYSPEQSAKHSWLIEASQWRLLNQESLATMRNLMLAVVEAYSGIYDGWEALPEEPVTKGAGRIKPKI